MPALNIDDLVFLDETWASTNMFRPRGRCRRGERLTCAVPRGHWKTTTFVAALTTRGLAAPMVLDGAMNADAFRAYVDQFLVPALRPGQIVVMDNVRFHKAAGVAESIAEAGCTLAYLPAYSPDFNPIETAFSKLKDLLRKAGRRTMDGLWEELGRAPDALGPAECRNRIRHCGYGAAASP